MIETSINPLVSASIWKFNHFAHLQTGQSKISGTIHLMKMDTCVSSGDFDLCLVQSDGDGGKKKRLTERGRKKKKRGGRGEGRREEAEEDEGEEED